MQTLILLLALLMLPGSAHADGWFFGSSGCSYTVCSVGCKLLDWDCSNADMTSNVCSIGTDKVASAVNEADLTTTPGAITLVDSTKNGADYYRLDIASYDIFPAGDITVEMTIDLSVISTNSRLLYANFDANNYMQIDIQSTSGNDIRILHRGAGGTLVNKTFDTNLSTSTPYNLVVKCGTTGGMAVSINGGSSYLTDDTKTITAMTHSGTAANGLSIGNQAAVNTEGTIDNVRISSGWRNDM